MDEVDPELLRTFEKLGVPMNEQKALAGVAVDVVFDSVSVTTTYKEPPGRRGHHLLQLQRGGARAPGPGAQVPGLGGAPPRTTSTPPSTRAVFTDGSFCFIPKGVTCPMDLSTYFRINNKESGQFERTLIVAEDGASVSYLEGCTAPQFDVNQLHAAVVELVALDDARIKYSTVQNWYAGDKDGVGGIFNFVTKRGLCKGRNSKSAGPRWRPAAPSPGSTPAACCWARTASASSTRWPSPTTSSRPTPAPR